MSSKPTDLWHTPLANGHKPQYEKRDRSGKIRKYPIPNLAAEVAGGKPYSQQVRERNAHNAFQQLTFLQAGFHAPHFLLPASAEAVRITATSGQNICALLKKQNRDTSLPKMFLESSPPTSTRCYLTWKVKRTPAGRSIFQLAPSMPPTDVTVSSSLPTPLNSAEITEEAQNNTGETAQDSGYLNPTWVEWLMGFPIGFTDLQD